MFLHLSVILFTGEGRLCPGEGLCPGVGADQSPRGSDSRGISFRKTPRYGNVREVGILLECILVTFGFIFCFKLHVRNKLYLTLL